MGDLVSQLGINAKLLIAQIINFLVLLGVLYLFAYKPILKMLHTRTKKIEDSIKNAEKVEQQLAQADKTYTEKVAEAQTKAQGIMEQAGKEVEKKKTETLIETKTRVQKIIDQSRAQIEQDKQKMLVEVKAEVTNLVIAVATKVLEREVKPEDNKKIIEETVKTIKN